MPLTALAAVVVVAASAAFACPPAEAVVGYEQVTPPDKNGGVVSSAEGFRARPDGQAFLFTGAGSFDGSPAESVPVNTRYLGTRSDVGWVRSALDAPFVDAGPDPTGGVFQYIQSVIGTSADLSHVLVATRAVLAPGAIPGGGSWYMRNTVTGEYRLVATSQNPEFALQAQRFGGTDLVVYVAEDGQSAQFTSDLPILDGLNPGPFESYLYAWTAGGGLRVESVLPAGEGEAPTPAITAGGLSNGPRDPMPLGSDGLDRVYFADANTSRLYVRSGDSAQRESKLVSYSRLDPNSPTPTTATPVSVSAGGRYVLFRTNNATRLTTDTPVGMPSTTRWLYLYDDDDDSLTYVGAVPSQFRVIQMAQDGGTVAFYSTLTQAGSTSDSFQKLFIWRRSTGLKYVYTSDSQAAITGRQNQMLRRLSDNGRFLAFVESAPSLAASFGFDAVDPKCNVPARPDDNCEQVYRYDIGAAKLECVSCLDGQSHLAYRAGDPNLVSAGVTYLNRYQARTIANDGTAFFTSTGDLVPGDVNGRPDVYARELDGTLRLISSGRPGTSARFLDATPDGASVFISTNDRLATSDVDDRVDVYRVAEGIGFMEEPPRIVPPCNGGDCRRPASPPPTLPNIGSITFGGDGNLPLVPDPVKVSVGVAKLKPVSGSAAWLKVRVAEAGRVSVAGSSIKRSGVSASKAGTYKVKIALSSKAKQTLKKKKTLKISARVSFRAKSGQSASKTISVTFKQPKAKRAPARKGGR